MGQARGFKATLSSKITRNGCTIRKLKLQGQPGGKGGAHGSPIDHSIEGIQTGQGTAGKVGVEESQDLAHTRLAVSRSASRGDKSDSKTCTEELRALYQQERVDEANSGSQWPVLRRLRPWSRRKELWLLRVVMA